ncbi:MAG: tRNA (adenine(22)-N(1))-methyltransferase TrmK [Acholeplasmatales bacterium]|nr:tRNA (adenine(22)-N(1))-methyltransferase TrmK [Acholeplasmatales bacterium]
MDRIELIASLAKDSKLLLDIGCDHAYSLIYAIKKYNVNHAIASDISDGPLENAKKNIIDNDLLDKIDIIKSDGLKNIDSNFDTLIISGMGGILIKTILEDGLDKIKGKKLIIEANSDTYLVRKFLTSNGFIIENELPIFDSNKYYEIEVFVPGNRFYTKYELTYGPILLSNKDEVFINEIKNKLKKLEEYLPNIKDTILKDEKLVIRNEYNKIILGDNTKMIPINNTDNYYREYFIDNKKRPLIVISAGGGYKYTSPRESEPIAKFYNDNGYHSIIINYRETLDLYPVPQNITADVIKLFEKDDRVSKIIGLGFSAGGHNILEVALHKDIYNANIDLLILGYPVITSDNRYWHKGSYQNLIGDLNNKELLNRLSLENEVKDDSPDLFLWGTFTDESVHVMNSLLLVEAYKKHNCNCEYHMFPMGGHGLSLANESTSGGDKNKEIEHVSKWAEMSLEWLNLKLK